MDDSYYTLDEPRSLQWANMSPLFVESISNWFRADKELSTDDYLDRWGYANHNRDTRTSSNSDNITVNLIMWRLEILRISLPFLVVLVLL